MSIKWIWCLLKMSILWILIYFKGFILATACSSSTCPKMLCFRFIYSLTYNIIKPLIQEFLLSVEGLLYFPQLRLHLLQSTKILSFVPNLSQRPSFSLPEWVHSSNEILKSSGEMFVVYHSLLICMVNDCHSFQ